MFVYRQLAIVFCVSTILWQTAAAEVSLSLQDGAVEVFGSATIQDGSDFFEDRAADGATIQPNSRSWSAAGSTSTGGVDDGSIVGSASANFSIVESVNQITVDFSARSRSSIEIVDNQEGQIAIGVATSEIGAQLNGRPLVLRLNSNVGPLQYRVLESSIDNAFLSIGSLNDESKGGIDLLSVGATGILHPGEYFFNFSASSGAFASDPGSVSSDSSITYRLQMTVPEPVVSPALLVVVFLHFVRRKRIGN